MRSFGMHYFEYVVNNRRIAGFALELFAGFSCETGAPPPDRPVPRLPGMPTTDAHGSDPPSEDQARPAFAYRAPRSHEPDDASSRRTLVPGLADRTVKPRDTRGAARAK